MNKVMIQDVIDAIGKTKEIIDFAFQMAGSIKYETIKPEYILPEVVFVEGQYEYIAKRDWTKQPDIFKKDFSNALMISMIGYQAIVCKESYGTLFTHNKSDISDLLFWEEISGNKDLFAAQKILENVRHALGHFKISHKAEASKPNGWGSWVFINSNGASKKLGILNVDSIKVSLDTTNLHDKQFDWKHLGGIENFIKVLDFLQDDLSKKLKNYLA